MSMRAVFWVVTLCWIQAAGAARLELFSPEGTAKDVRQVTARFSEPMVAFGDPRLADPFTVDCPVRGRGRWAEPRTWVYDFEADLPAGLSCRFRPKAQLKALSGAPVDLAREYRFDTGGPVVVGSYPSEGSENVDENQVFLLAAAAPATPESVTAHARCRIEGMEEAIGVDVLTGERRDAVLAQRRKLGWGYTDLLWPDADFDSLEPEEIKAGEARLVLVQCRRAIPPETKVSIFWGRDIAAPSGVATTEDQELSFKSRPSFTARFGCERINAEADCIPLLPMSLRFGAPVPADQAAAVRLVDAAGKVYPADGLDPGRKPFVEELSWKGPFPEKSMLRIELPPGFVDDAGRPLENASRYPLEVKTDEYPPLAKFPGEFGILELKEGGVLPVTVRHIENPMTGQRLASGGPAIPGKVKRVALSDQDIAAWMRKVKKAAERRGESVQLPDGGTEWKELTGTESVFADTPAETFELPRAEAQKEFEVLGIPLENAGFYVVELASPRLGAALLGEERPRYVATSALVTNLSVHFKWGRESSLVWVTTLDSARPVPNADVRISRYCKDETLWQGRTDANGVALIQGPALPNPSDSGESCDWGDGPLMVSARTEDDMSFTLSSWTNGISPQNFGLAVGFYGNPEIVHSVLDRSLFRAGETVSMKHFQRLRTSNGFGLPDTRPAKIKVRHTGSGQEYELPAEFDARGIAENTWAIPAEAKLGGYEIVFVYADGSESATSAEFRVEQFRVPTMRADIQPQSDALINAREATLDLHVSYLSGGGAANAPVKVRTLVEPRAVSFPGYPDFDFEVQAIEEGLRDSGYSEEAEKTPGASGPAQVLPLSLDKGGAARVTVPNLPRQHTPQDLVAELEYQDANGELLTVARRIPLWPAGLSLGIKTDGWVATRDQVRFQVLALDLTGKPAVGKEVRVDLYSRTTYSHRKRLIGGFYAYDDKTEVKRLGSECKGKTNDQGLLLCVLAPGVSGEILLQATADDGTGNQALGTASIWVASEDEWWFENGPSDRMDVIAEKRAYELGDKARLQVRMPFREATALVTIEREGIVDSFITPLSGRSPVVEVPIKEAYAPNVFVSVLAVRGRVGPVQTWIADMARKFRLPWQPDGGKATTMIDLSKPAYRMGLAQIDVGWAPNRLDVKVQADRDTYKVRETAKVKVTVQRATGGAPADAEIALAAVDEGLLEIKPNESWNLLDKMMGRRGIEVLTSTAQMQVVGKRHYGRKAVPHGGGGGRQAARELFDTLLLWKGRVALDTRGEAEIEVPLNDSLTAFRLVAIANAGSGLFGTGKTSIRTTQDLMLYSGLPPMVREGDRFHAIFNVRNATDRKIAGRLSARLTPKGTAAGQDLPPRPFELEAGTAGDFSWEVDVPVDVAGLDWEIAAAEDGGAATDRLKTSQQVQPAVPVRVFQATLTRIDKPLSLAVQRPEDAVPGRGGVRVSLRARLGDGLGGVIEYMTHYPYSCLEQKVSKAVALRDKRLWNEIVADLPAYQDADGLFRYFPGDDTHGSDVLTAYVLAIAQEAGWELPENALGRAKEALKGFVEGRVLRDSALPTADLSIRKLAAVEALARYEEAMPELLDSIRIEPRLWPTSAVLDWLSVLQRVEAIPDRSAKLKEAEQTLRARLNFQGTTLNFSSEKNDALWWLMISPDLNAVRAVLGVMELPGWREDIPRLVTGALGRQTKGRWNTTTANAWGRLAMERFSEAFESVPVTGYTEANLGAVKKGMQWTEETRRSALNLPWPDGPGTLEVRHQGTGKPWAIVQSRAAIPLKEPLFTGFSIKRTVTPVERKQPGAWNRGDVARVTLELDAQSDMSWVVVDDPIPAGASILGGGLGRDSALLTRGERQTGWTWPIYEERRFDAYRAYYDYVPKGKWNIEYTVRYNNPGSFELPPTRVEAMYAPEMFGELPNKALVIGVTP
ncbi:conserved domain protein [Methylococcus capsulatus str. Bath]|uniref:Conserved domain protein n=1 Tax=Methylococcus capsulatus (strain ATCC 33009 / NCIMB 11132 / Bath) TaxID=243233 RepID=Q607K7_METCA|nr:MG2 domain-containing protein [Methylococcus capsulatus]AAU91956.1 conserved domain protein [Methylococcus capsulatus str. Bath]